MAAADPTLVFAHYFGGSAKSWVPLCDALGGAADRIVPDLPGFGGRAAFAQPGLDAYADDLIARAGAREWIAVGHSMGGKIALSAAVRQPRNLLGLVLIAASPPTPQPMSDDERAASLKSFGSPQAARRRFKEIAPQLPSALVKICVEDSLKAAKSAWEWWLEQGSRDDISARTQDLKLPVLVITGDDDRVLGPNTAAQIARGLRNAALRTIAGAGHLVPIEHPHAVARLIQGFAAKVGVEAA